ncbi:MAG: glutamate--tRNA ligase [Cytophagales bacterium]|jgi:glutamyl-tRNA synthetase|nr:glutamate--tRNA ligase [Cytophagales bacterium]MCA6388097.1 glutamate--tRNA ligase [Cytophagales bacterium]MCA6391218.1 glutamate--tRNA ligase [Cytophagales bacterium]MCA6395418.1 glutamate--tRNA ligase [Cytophagales bacterium]MCA6399970.1 glutamate--tRNA ligase [Cytophagales bacterium]
MKPVRVRFAPSPTGALHIGGVRTALYNYLLARKHNGTMILRIEDTDQNRYVPGAEEYIINSLNWVGIQIDEGVGKGGPHAPYRQSERKPIYKQYAQQLVDEGNAYYAFDTEQDLEAMRERLKAAGDANQQYGSGSRMQMNNSLTLKKEEVDKKLAAGDAYVIRLKVPTNKEVRLTDLIRGEVVVNSSQIDDKVLMKSDGMPTYHLANVVDDYLMKISHVIRGEEWLPSAPLHVLLYQFLGWQNEMPQFAHLPLLLKPDGNGKLSKRDADRIGFPIFPLNWTDPATKELATGFKESGFLPEALINFLAFLGWNPGTEKEIFSMTELVEAFSLERIGKAGAKFDIQKAQWFNQHYLRSKSDKELADYLLASLTSEGISCSHEKAEKICFALRERITFPRDLWEQGKIFFSAPTTFDQQIVAKKWNLDAVRTLRGFIEEIKVTQPFSADAAKLSLEKVTGELGIKTGQILQPLRMSITGGASGPDLMLTMEILGKEETVNRIKYALENFQVAGT